MHETANAQVRGAYAGMSQENLAAPRATAATGVFNFTLDALSEILGRVRAQADYVEAVADRAFGCEATSGKGEASQAPSSGFVGTVAEYGRVIDASLTRLAEQVARLQAL